MGGWVVVGGLSKNLGLNKNFEIQKPKFAGTHNPNLRQNYLVFMVASANSKVRTQNPFFHGEIVISQDY